jgi:hypothetical protein
VKNVTKIMAKFGPVIDAAGHKIFLWFWYGFTPIALSRHSRILQGWAKVTAITGLLQLLL